MQRTLSSRNSYRIPEATHSIRRCRRARIAAAAALAIAGIGSPLLGAEKTWIGPAGASWNVSSWWSPAGVPAPGDDAYFQPSGSNSYLYNGTYTTGSPLGSLTLGGTGDTPTLNQSSSTLSVGTESILSGTFNQTGGIDNISKLFNISGPSATTGTYSVGGGSLTVGSSGAVNIGDGGGSGTFLQSAGSTNLGDDVVVGNQYYENAPGPAVHADAGGFFASTGTLSLTGGSLSATGGITYVGYLGGNGIYKQSAGSSDLGNGGGFGNYLILGDGGSADFSGLTSTGTVALSGGTMSGDVVYVGYNDNADGGGVGEFLQNGGASNLGPVYVGDGTGSIGTVSLSSGTMTDITYVGFNGGVGTYSQVGSLSVSSFASLTIGSGTGSTGTASLSNGSLTASSASVGSGGGVGTFLQSGGSSFFSDYLYVGSDAGSAGTVLLSGGTLTANIGVNIGVGGAGTFIQSAGYSSLGNLNIGDVSSGTGSLTGGTLTAFATTVGAGGAGQFLQNGGYSNLGSGGLGGGLFVGDGSSGTVSLSAGTLTSGTTTIGDGAAGTFLESESGGIASLGALQVSSTGVIMLSSGTLNAETLNNGGSISVFEGTLSVTGGGALNGTALTTGQTLVGYDGGGGTLVQSGSLSQSVLGTLTVGSGTGSTGVASLSGGSLTASNADVGTFGGVGTLLQSGGSSSLGYVLLASGTTSAGTVSLSGGSITTQTLVVGALGGNGTLLQSSGSSSLGNLVVSSNGGGGTVSLSGGSLSATTTTVGFTQVSYPQGNGTLLQNGGSSSLGALSVGGGFIANETTSTGIVSLTGGSLTASSTEIGGGDGGGGTFLQSGSLTVSSLGTVTVGSVGTIVLSDGTMAASSVDNSGVVNNSGGLMLIGNPVAAIGGSPSTPETFVGYSGAAGTFTQEAGSSNLGQLTVGSGTGSTGVVSLSGGSLSGDGQTARVGFGGGAGTFLQSAGYSDLPNGLHIGEGMGSTGTVSLTGGTMSVPINGFIAVGWYGGAGTFLQSGSQSFCSTGIYGVIQIGNNGFTGYYSLSGGSLSSTITEVGDGGSGTFSQSGGWCDLSDSLNALVVGDGANGLISLSGGTLLAGATVVEQSGGAGTFLQSGSHSFSGLGTVTVGPSGTIGLSGGTMNVRSMSSTGTIIVSGGTLAITNAGTMGTSVINGVRISGNGVVDIGTSALVIPCASAGAASTLIGELTPNFGHTQTYPANSIQGYIQSAYDGGAWDDPGLTSSAAANDNIGLTAVGALDQNDLNNAEGGDYTGGNWMGVPITSDNTVLVRYTYYGDTDLDGFVGPQDVNNLELGYAGVGDGWLYGDFNYDGLVDYQDVNLLDLNYSNVPLGDVRMLTAAQSKWLLAAEKGLTAAQIAAFEARVGVPEPVGLGLLGVGAVGLLGRRRRSASKLAG
jgi:fibronectin-binding autotransporter adhesin